MDQSRPSIRVSKQLSLMLRHRPGEFGIKVDRWGYANLQEVLKSLQERDRSLTQNDIELVVNDSKKKRFEIKEVRIRACYGHTFPIDLGLDPITPPEFLYKGVEMQVVETVLREGLKPNDRQFVHLSVDLDVAERLGGGREGNGAVIRINAKRSHLAGVRFYDCGPTILTLEVPSDFVELEKRWLSGSIESTGSSFYSPVVKKQDSSSRGRDCFVYGRRPRPSSRR